MMNKEQALNYGKKIGVKYLIKNSNGGLLGGTTTKEAALEMQKEWQQNYKNDPWNKELKVYIETI